MGKGDYYRSGAKSYTGECLNLDIRMLHKKKMLYNYASFIWSWSSNLGMESSISCIVSGNSLELSYNSNSEPISYKVQLDRTPCNYGGHRSWFKCPNCGERVGVIYLRGKYFICRICANLNYASSQESGNWNNEAMRRLRGIQTKLNCKDWSPMDCIYKTPDRPLGMHRRTYERLLRTYQQRVSEYNNSFVAALEKYRV